MDNHKMKRGRPITTGRGTLIGVRMLDDQLAQLDQWIETRGDHELTRPEAIRQLVDHGLSKSTKKPASTSPEKASRASKLAGERIDHMGDKSTAESERQQRKKRLIKGPEEFRDMRVDQPRRKT